MVELGSNALALEEHNFSHIKVAKYITKQRHQ